MTKSISLLESSRRVVGQRIRRALPAELVDSGLQAFIVYLTHDVTGSGSNGKAINPDKISYRRNNCLEGIVSNCDVLEGIDAVLSSGYDYQSGGLASKTRL